MSATGNSRACFLRFQRDKLHDFAWVISVNDVRLCSMKTVVLTNDLILPVAFCYVQIIIGSLN